MSLAGVLAAWTEDVCTNGTEVVKRAHQLLHEAYRDPRKPDRAKVAEAQRLLEDALKGVRDLRRLQQTAKRVSSA